MLKISIRGIKTRRFLILEGRLIAPWANELIAAARQVRADCTADHEVIVDLRGVTHISPEGEEALYHLMVQGIKFRGGGMFIKEVLKQLAKRVR